MTILSMHSDLNESHATAVFKRLLPLASQYNIRLVLVNRRDYPNSSPYTDKDLEKLNSSDDWAQDEFAKGRAQEYATFIRRFVEQESTPEMTVDGKDGGIVLLSWSSGVAYTIPLLSFADSLPEDLRDAIEPYLRLYVSFGECMRVQFIHSLYSSTERLRTMGSWAPSDGPWVWRFKRSINPQRRKSPTL